jgi:hypothetical protein
MSVQKGIGPHLATMRIERKDRAMADRGGPGEGAIDLLSPSDRVGLALAAGDCGMSPTV